MIFPESTNAAETIQAENTELGCSIAFDFAARKFQLADGTPKSISGMDAAKQWLELLPMM